MGCWEEDTVELAIPVVLCYTLLNVVYIEAVCNDISTRSHRCAEEPIDYIYHSRHVRRILRFIGENGGWQAGLCKHHILLFRLLAESP